MVWHSFPGPGAPYRAPRALTGVAFPLSASGPWAGLAGLAWLALWLGFGWLFLGFGWIWLDFVWISVGCCFGFSFTMILIGFDLISVWISDWFRLDFGSL